ncbi:hypothetical protein ACFE04_006891 [Oxalis oulophora]
MQITTLSLAPSRSYYYNKPPNKTIYSKFTLFSNIPSSNLSFNGNQKSPFFSLSTCFNTRISTTLLSKCDIFKVKATHLPDDVNNLNVSESDNEESSSVVSRTMQLGASFAIWYLLNIYFNIFNKQYWPLDCLICILVLKVFPFPATVTAFQLGCGTLTILIMWTFNLHPKPKLTRAKFAAILPLAVAHTLGNLLTNISLGRVAVSFTHTIKAMEPFFTVLFSLLFLGEGPSFWVVSSLVPVVGGVALASFTESSFNWIGFCSAMASNVTNQSRNETLDNINLFSVITIFAFLLLAPTAILTDGIKLSPSYLQSAANQGLDVRQLLSRLILSGFCFHTYQQVSYGILQKVSPVTHSVGNCLKRVVVIVSSVIFFQTPVSPINSLGTALALAGVFLYSRAKRMTRKLKVV